jgi:hypothetical protein
MSKYPLALIFVVKKFKNKITKNKNKMACALTNNFPIVVTG